MSVGAVRAVPARVSGEGDVGPSELHEELRALAAEPQLALQRPVLEEMAAAVERGEGLSAWSGGGLVAAHAGDGALAPGQEGAAVWARRLASATAVMVYFPLVLTWSGLGLAMYAYHEARQEDPAQLQGSFLELWQQGFAGHLPGLLRFDQLVWYTIALLGTLVGLTLYWRRVQHRADEQDRRLLRRLAQALARVESAAVVAAHTEPRKFTEELQTAAVELRELLVLSDRAGELSQGLLREAVTASTAAVSATQVMDASAAALREAVDSIASSSREAAAAADRLTRGAADLGEAVQTSTSTLTTGMVSAAEEAARRIVESVTVASDRFGEAAAAASGGFREAAAVASGGFGEAAAAASSRFEEAAAAASGGFQKSVAVASGGFGEAAAVASDRFGEAAAAASDRFGEAVAQAVVGQEAQAARQAAEGRELLVEGRDALARAAEEMRQAAAGLTWSVAALPQALEEAAGTGADHIGLAYETAVTALAASLQAEVRQAGETLAARTTDALARQDESHRDIEKRQLASEQRLLASAAESRSVLDKLVARIDELGARLEELERHEETVQARTRQDRQQRATALRRELTLLDQLRERQEQLLDAWADHRSTAAGPNAAAPNGASAAMAPLSGVVPDMAVPTPTGAGAAAVSGTPAVEPDTVQPDAGPDVVVPRTHPADPA